MDWSQDIYLALLLISSGAALHHGGRRGIVAVMWANFIATMVFSGNPVTVGVADITCAAALVSIGGKRALAIAALFAAMIPLYLLSKYIGNYATYSIVDLLAYSQLLILGGGGYGGLIRLVRGMAFYTSLRSVRSSYIVSPMEKGRHASRGSGHGLEGDKVEGISK